uniref:Uncharacterized protein n=1 Tax=Megaselia scalaris TaxID=36166 RepID=T1GQ86_MEGSC
MVRKGTIRKIKSASIIETNDMTAEISLNKFKRGTLRKQQSQQINSYQQEIQQNNNEEADFIFTRSQQKCNNISIQLPFEIRKDRNSLDSSDSGSIVNNNLFLQTPNTTIASKNEQPISLFSKCDLTSPNRNNNFQLLDHSYERSTAPIPPPVCLETTPNIDSNKKYKAPTTPHRIVCQFRTIDAVVPEELTDTKIVHENNNENDMDTKSSK